MNMIRNLQSAVWALVIWLHRTFGDFEERRVGDDVALPHGVKLEFHEGVGLLVVPRTKHDSDWSAV